MRLLLSFLALFKLRLLGSYVVYRARFYEFACSLGGLSNFLFAGVAAAIALPLTLLIRLAWHVLQCT
jgi:hypothetical protein